MEPMNTITDQTLELSREPCESITAPSLGQAAEAMDAMYRRRGEESDLTRDEGRIGGRTTSANARPDTDRLNQVNVLESGSDAVWESQHKDDEDTTSCAELGPIDGELHDQPSEDLPLHQGNVPLSFVFLRQSGAHSTSELQHHENRASADTQKHLPAKGDPSSIAVLALERPQGHYESPFEDGTVGTSESAAVLGRGQPENSHGIREVHSQGHDREVQDVPNVPDEAGSTNPEASTTTPAWIAFIGILMLFARDAVLTAVSLSFGVICMGSALACDGFTGGWGGCIQYYQAKSTVKTTIHIDGAADPVIGDHAGMTDGVREHNLPIPQCHHCSSDDFEPPIVMCPAGHPICSVCFFTEVILQTSRGSSVVECKGAAGCRQPYPHAEVQAMMEDIDLQPMPSSHLSPLKVVSGDERETLVRLEEGLSGLRLEEVVDASSRIQDAMSRCIVALHPSVRTQA